MWKSIFPICLFSFCVNSAYSSIYTDSVPDEKTIEEDKKDVKEDWMIVDMSEFNDIFEIHLPSIKHIQRKTYVWVKCTFGERSKIDLIKEFTAADRKAYFSQRHRSRRRNFISKWKKLEYSLCYYVFNCDEGKVKLLTTNMYSSTGDCILSEEEGEDFAKTEYVVPETMLYSVFNAVCNN